MKKKIVIAVSAVVLITGFSVFRYSVKHNLTKNEIVSEKNEEDKDYKEVKYLYNDGINKPVEVVINQPPKRAVTLSQFMTEMLLSLGLQNQMVGTALLDNNILPEYKEAYDKIPRLDITQGHNISKEGFMSLKPDFASGWLQSLTEKGTGSPQELEKEGIAPYVVSALNGNATIENVYSDYKELGKIFNVEDKANEVIEHIKKQVNDVEKEVHKVKEEEKPKVLVYDSGEKDAFVVGGGFANNLITLAGGKNIFADLENQWNNVSFESIAKRNPQIILITDYLAQAESFEEKVKFLKTNPAFKNVDAIKNNRIYKIELADLSPGIRIPKAINEMNEVFYAN